MRFQMTDKQFRWAFCLIYAVVGAVVTPMNVLGVILLVVGTIAAYIFAYNFPIYVRRRARDLQTVLHAHDQAT